MRGILAFDIDGTLTDSPFSLSDVVQKKLEEMHGLGWQILFITGRPFVWGVKPLEGLKFSYYLAVINGANIIQMPEGKLVQEAVIDPKELNAFDAFCREYNTDFVAYAGYSDHDRCFYRPSGFTSDQLNYLLERSASFGEKWVAVQNFQVVPVRGFASIKCFGTRDLCLIMSRYMENELKLHAPVIRDPFNMHNYVAQATLEGCNKGSVLNWFKQFTRNEGLVIAAGDDYNDVSMLEQADVKIVMSTAPKELLDIADIIAPPASLNGIVTALECIITL